MQESIQGFYVANMLNFKSLNEAWNHIVFEFIGLLSYTIFTNLVQYTKWFISPTLYTLSDITAHSLTSVSSILDNYVYSRHFFVYSSKFMFFHVSSCLFFYIHAKSCQLWCLLWSNHAYFCVYNFTIFVALTKHAIQWLLNKCENVHLHLKIPLAHMI